jgi:hypothetical protein
VREGSRPNLIWQIRIGSWVLGVAQMHKEEEGEGEGDLATCWTWWVAHTIVQSVSSSLKRLGDLVSRTALFVDTFAKDKV